MEQWRKELRNGAVVTDPEIMIAEKARKTPDFQRNQVFWWGMVDSNHRRHSQQIYSLSPLATREIPHMNLLELSSFWSW